LQDLVHVLAALALMGLGCLWQLMNLSANFAHARRDIRGLQQSNPDFVAGVRHAI
jgi:thiosulfate reductase cytochrome b subunit